MDQFMTQRVSEHNILLRQAWKGICAIPGSRGSSWCLAQNGSFLWIPQKTPANKQRHPRGAAVPEAPGCRQGCQQVELFTWEPCPGSGTGRGWERMGEAGRGWERLGEDGRRNSGPLRAQDPAALGCSIPAATSQPGFESQNR